MRNILPLLTSGILLLSISLFAGNVKQKDARLAGKNFYYETINQYYDIPYPSLIITSEFVEKQENEPVYYVFNFNDKGFVIVAADDIVYPILGYSFESSYSQDNQPDNFRLWMNSYKEQIKRNRDNKIQATPEISNQWKHLLTTDIIQLDNRKGILDVLPLTTAKWDQTFPYNAKCPSDTNAPEGYNDRVPTGCIATAMAQIMYYYRYPDQGLGSHCIEPQPSYGPQCADFGATTYEWNGMTDMTGQECDPIALVTYHAGIAVDMNYGPAVSVTGLSKIAPAFKNYFRYAGTVTLQYRQFFSYASWTDKMKADLDAGQPIIYYGDDGTAGHAWICDGYQGTDMFHMNWGWSGNYNGYFNIDDLNPGSFNPDLNQAAVFGIIPDPAQYPYYCNGQTNLTTYGSGTIEDGSGPVNNYQPGFNCAWLIRPDDSVQNITLNFTRFSTSAGDYLTIHDGTSEDDPVLGSFSGSSVPAEITSTGPALFLTFNWGGDASVSSGWMVKYNSNYHPFCSGETVLTDPSGTITDGSGRFSYRNNSSCNWKIMPECPNPGPATLKFTTFNTEQGPDKMEIFDLVSGSLLATYSGDYSTPPDSVTSPSGKMLISFLTSPAVRNDGWEATYHVKCYGQAIDEKTIEDLLVYPVPADDLLNISFTDRFSKSIQIGLISVEGKTVYSDKIVDFNSMHSRKIDLSHLETGIYYLRIIGDATVMVTKIVVRKQ